MNKSAEITGKAVIAAAMKLVHAQERGCPRATEVAIEKELYQAVKQHEEAR